MHRRDLQSADSGHDDNADGAPFQQDERNFFDDRHSRSASTAVGMLEAGYYPGHTPAA